MYGKFCGGRITEGHGELSFSKDILNVYHKPSKVLGTRGCSSEHILKTKMSLHGGRRELRHSSGRSGKASEWK